MSAEFFSNPQMLAPPQALKTAHPDGGFVLRSPVVLGPYARCVGEWLEHWAITTPQAPAFAERTPSGDWRRLNWAQTRTAVGRVAQGLLDLGLAPQAPDAPIVVLSDNSLDHLLLMLAALHIGRPVCTVSSAYSRLTKDSSKIVAILQALDPALVYASDAKVYSAAAAHAGPAAQRVFSEGAELHPGALAFTQLLATDESAAVMQAFGAITPDAPAKYLLTSGSTGTPKVVVNSHRMLCANQQMVAQAWRFLAHEKPVLVDWLPWSHTFGGNHNLNMVLCHGGQLVVDEGRPAPGLIDKSVRNLCEIQPTVYFNVPRGLDLLLPHLEADNAMATAFFARLRVVFYAGAALPQATWERLQALAVRVRGTPVWLTTSWGSTETSPAITSAHWQLDRAGVIGGVLPGLELKFIPVGGGTDGAKLEMRVRGVSIFKHYRNAPDITAAAFDDEGYYRIGDAGFLADEARPEMGVVFNGRVAEDFKLTTGTWVSVGTLRLAAVSAMAPWVQDVVVTGHDRNDLGLLIFPSLAGAALASADLSAKVALAMGTMKVGGAGSSQSPARALLLVDPPSVDAGEITDKGYINQGAVLRQRAALVQALYANGAGVIYPH